MHVRQLKKRQSKGLVIRRASVFFITHTAVKVGKEIITMAEEKLFTQEQVDALIGERLARQKEKLTNEYNEKYSDYDTLKAAKAESDAKIEQLTASLTEANEKLNGTDQTINELTSKVTKYETDSVKTRVALENGIPYEMASRLQGSTEEEIRNDALNVSKLFSTPMPMASTEPDGKGNAIADATRQMLKSLKGEE